MSIIDRINIIRENEGLNKSEFERSINKSSGYLNMLEKKKAMPSAEVLIDVTDLYPNYNLKWILKGEGEMLRGHVPEGKSLAMEQGEKYQTKTEIMMMLEQRLADKELIIKLQEEKIQELQKNKRKLDAI